LFRSGVFSVTSLVGLIIGMGMFGGMSVIPLYLQIVKGASPTRAGLLVLPMVLGIMVGSVVSGQITARTGRYKVFPIVGIGLMTAAMVLLNTIGADTPLWRTDIWMAIFGLGLGNCIQTLVIAVQNAVPARDMGVATSAQVFFRQIGGTLGTAVFLSILFSVVGGKIGTAIMNSPAEVRAAAAKLLGSTASGSSGGSGVLQDSSFIQQLPAAVARPFKVGFSDSLHPVFITAAIVTGTAFVLIWFMKELPLRNQSGIQARLAEEGGAPAALSVADRPAAVSAANGVPAPGLASGNGRHALAVGDSTTAHNTAGASSMASVSEGFVSAHTEGLPIYGHVRRSDGSAIADAALTLIDPSGRQVGRGVSDVDGGYQLAAPGAGTYVLIASASAHQPQASAVPVGGGPVSLDVVLSGTSGLTGTVTVAGQGTPVTGATATLADDRGEVVGARPTGADGRYAFGELVAGTYTLVVSSDGYQPAALSVSVPGTGEFTQDVELIGGSKLRGVATVGDGRVVPDARITLLDRAGNVVAVTTTDGSGEYGFTDLPEGDYTVIASGYPPVASTLRVHGGEFSSHDVHLGHPNA
jgi:hypothetical protein